MREDLWIPILCALAVLILSSCVSTPPKTPPTDFYSALSPRPVASFHQDYSEADLAFFRFLRACIQDPQSNDIVMSSKPFNIDDLLWNMRKLIPGGFLFVEGEDLQIYRVMKMHGFPRLPFNWKSYSIYRKPLEASA